MWNRALSDRAVAFRRVDKRCRRHALRVVATMTHGLSTLYIRCLKLSTTVDYSKYCREEEYSHFRQNRSTLVAGEAKEMPVAPRDRASKAAIYFCCRVSTTANRANIRTVVLGNLRNVFFCNTPQRGRQYGRELLVHLHVCWRRSTHKWDIY